MEAIITAIHMGHESITRLRIDRGVPVKGQYEPLNCAASSEHEGMVPLLLKYGADVNLGGYEDDYMGLIKLTPLICAASNGRDRAVRLLLEHGADANARAGGPFRHLNDILTWLMRRLWEYYPSHKAGSAVVYAAKQGHTTTVQLLLDHGVDISIKDELGRTALKYASDRGFKEIEELLLNYDRVTV